MYNLPKDLYLGYKKIDNVLDKSGQKTRRKITRNDSQRNPFTRKRHIKFTAQTRLRELCL